MIEPVSRRAFLTGALTAGLVALIDPASSTSDQLDAAKVDEQLPLLKNLIPRDLLVPPATTPSATPSVVRRPIPHFTTPPTQWGYDLPGIVQRIPGRKVALTFDACGGPGGSGVDQILLAALRQHRVPATLFLNQRWIQANPRLAHELAADQLFNLQNHGTSHRPLSTNGRTAYGIAGTPTAVACEQEVLGCTATLTKLTGKPPRFFRSGTAHYDEQAIAIVQALGQTPLGFSISGDHGATLPATAVTANYLAARPGDIIIGHMNQPQSGTGAGVAAALPILLKNGVQFTTIAAVL